MAVTDELKPNQLLVDYSRRDVETVTGTKLTLIDTPHILRDIQENYLSLHRNSGLYGEFVTSKQIKRT